MKTNSYPLILLCLFFVSCGTNRVEMLSDRAESYNRSVRWASMATASTMIAPEQRRSLTEQVLKHLGKNRIVDYAILDFSVDPKQQVGTLVVEYSFYGIVDQNLTSRQEVQSWKYDPKEKNWFLTAIKPVTAP